MEKKKRKKRKKVIKKVSKPTCKVGNILVKTLK